MMKKVCLLLALIWMTLMVSSVAAAAFPVLRVGSKGAHVVTLQKRLAELGFFRYPADGKYGAQTANAVKRFQTRNGIKATGVVNALTAKRMQLDTAPTPVPEAALPPAPKAPATAAANPREGDLYLLARVVYGQARDEPYIGQVAIAAVVLNRVRNKQFPNTIPAVVYQPNAFSVVSNGRLSLTPDDTALRAARDAMNGMDPTGGAVFYYHSSEAENGIAPVREETVTIGNHHFYS